MLHCTCVDFLPTDQRVAALGFSNGHVTLKTPDGPLTATYERAAITRVKFFVHQGIPKLVSIDEEGLVLVSDVADMKKFFKLPHEVDRKWRVSVSMDGRYIVTISNKKVHVWDMDKMSSLRQFTRHMHSSAISSAAISSDNKKFAYGGYMTGTVVLQNFNEENADGHSEFRFTGGGINDIVFAPEAKSKLMLTHVDDEDSYLALSNYETLELVWKSKQYETLLDVVWSPSGKSIGSISWHGVRRWDATTGEETSQQWFEEELPIAVRGIAFENATKPDGTESQKVFFAKRNGKTFEHDETFQELN